MWMSTGIQAFLQFTFLTYLWRSCLSASAETGMVLADVCYRSSATSLSVVTVVFDFHITRPPGNSRAGSRFVAESEARFALQLAVNLAANVAVARGGFAASSSASLLLRCSSCPRINHWIRSSTAAQPRPIEYTLLDSLVPDQLPTMLASRSVAAPARQLFRAVPRQQISRAAFAKVDNTAAALLDALSANPRSVKQHPDHMLRQRRRTRLPNSREPRVAM